MQLWQEIYRQLSDGEEDVTGLQFTVWENRGGYFQNVKGISGFTSKEIALTLPRNHRLRILGEGLEVKKYYEGDVLVGGRILSVLQDGE